MPFVQYSTAPNDQVGSMSRIVKVAKMEAAVAPAAGETDVAAYPDNIPNSEVVPGWWVQPSGTGAGTVSPYPIRPARPVAEAFAKLHQESERLYAELTRQLSGFKPSAESEARKTLFAARQFSYLLAHSDDFTAAQKIAYCTRMPGGPTDIPVADASALEGAVRKFLTEVDKGDFTAPEVPKAWVDPATGNATALRAMVTISGTVPELTDLAGGGWIDGLTI